MTKKNLPEERRGYISPFRAMSQLQNEVDRLFEDFMQPTSWWGESRREALGFSPACDVEETDSHYLLSFDLPGLSKNDIHVDLSDNILTVSGERKEEHEERKPYRKERYYGSFSRSMTLPAGINADQVEANFENGVLQIAVPKTEQAKGKKVEIGHKREGGFFSRLLGQKEKPSQEKQRQEHKKTEKVA